jgi:lipoprotein-anchoring transpeptidase ErfK/SrfK
MRHICLPAFLSILFVVPALADPLQIAPDTPSAAGRQTLPPAQAAPRTYATASAQPNRGGGLGGGFIEFLAGGGAHRSAAPAAPTPPVVQSGYEPAPAAAAAYSVRPAYQLAPAAAQPLPPPESNPSLPPLTLAEAATLTPAQAAALGIEMQPAPVARPEPAARSESVLRPQLAAGPATEPTGVDAIGHPPVDPKFDRQVVAYTGEEQPGTIIIDTPNKFLYLVQEDGKALRYGIGVGRPGFTWAGVKEVTAKREWPDWIPPDDMLHRQPNLPRFMAGGPENPLGARAIYLGSTLYRIHGSNEPWTIGSNVSSGCIRLRNADVIDLYSRVKVGTRVVVM